MREWRDVVGLEDRYEVSNDGLVRTKPKILKASKTIKGGHLQINLGSRRRTYVHRLVAEAFLEKKVGKPIVNHKNGIPSDNRVDNLEWVSYGENIAHGYRVNGRKQGTEIRVRGFSWDNEATCDFESMATAARYFGVTTGAIRSAILRKGKCRGFYWIKL